MSMNGDILNYIELDKENKRFIKHLTGQFGPYEEFIEINSDEEFNFICEEFDKMKQIKSKYNCKNNTIDLIKDFIKTIDKIYEAYVICDNYRTRDCLVSEIKYYIEKIKDVIKWSEEE